MHIEGQCYFATAPGAAPGAAAAFATGDSATLKNAKQDTFIHLVDIIAKAQGAGSHMVVGPHMSDTTRGIFTTAPVGTFYKNIQRAKPEPLYPQDTMAVTIIGSAVAGDIEMGVLVLLYDDMPGISAQMLMPDDVRKRGVRMVPTQVSCVTGAGGGWTGAAALNSLTDLLRPNTDYALLGACTATLCGAIGVRSPNWGNVRVPIPGDIITPRGGVTYLEDLSNALQRPCIPVLNSGNKTSTFVDVATDENAGTFVANLQLVELAPA